jgi:hypothetical protein
MDGSVFEAARDEARGVVGTQVIAILAIHRRVFFVYSWEGLR